MARKTMAQLIRERFPASADHASQRDDTITQVPTPSPDMATLQLKYADPHAVLADALLPETPPEGTLEVREISAPTPLHPTDRSFPVGKRLSLISTVNGVSTEMGAQG